MIKMTARVGLGLVLGAFAVGCATTGSQPAMANAPAATAKMPAATVPPPAATAPPPTPPAAKPGDAKALLRAAVADVEQGRLDHARVLLDQARALVGTDRDLDLRATHVAIAVFTSQGDYEAAARAILDAIRRRSGDPADAQLFSLHNWMAIVREAQGNLTGAIVACAERTAIGYEGTWEPAAERLKQTRFKDDWHRAYLFRMLAEQSTGTRRESALLAAETARKDYVAAGGYPDSIAVLDALFAMYDHRWDDVRAAVRKVDIAKDDDEEDLLLVVQRARRRRRPRGRGGDSAAHRAESAVLGRLAHVAQE